MEIRILQLIKGLDIGNRSGGSDKFGLELTKALKHSGAQVCLGVLNTFGTEIEKLKIIELEKLSIPVVFIEDETHSQKLTRPNWQTTVYKTE